jgi:hypothetical protein
MVKTPEGGESCNWTIGLLDYSGLWTVIAQELGLYNFRKKKGK